MQKSILSGFFRYFKNLLDRFYMSKPILRSLITCGVVAGLFLGQSLYAQGFKEDFGKNRIQYKAFDWSYYASENFEVYFYDGGDDLANKTIEYLESEFSRITETIGYFPFSKTRVFLYNSIVDKQQSNVGVRGRDFTIGGQTNFVQSQVEIAYSGDFASFKKKSVFAVSDMLIQEMLYGGNIAEMFQSSFTTPIPIWFTAGISSYIAHGWNKETDDAVRDYIANNSQNKFVKLSNDMNILMGQSIWNFIAQRYGQRSISNILNLARIIRNEENSIERTLGVPYRQFLNDWRSFYGNLSVAIAQETVVPNADFIISGKNRKDAIFTDVEFNSTGRYLAYAALNDGRFRVQVVDMNSQRTTTVYKGGLKLIDQEVDKSQPILSWADSTTLGVVYSEAGANVLVVKRLGVKGEQKIPVPLLSNIQSFEFKEGGRLAVMTGDINGVSDAFIYNLVRGQVRRITSDNYDERDITYIPGTNQIVFSSNRPTDSVFVSGPETLDEAESHQFNLYTYDLDFPDSTFGKITNALAVNLKPFAPNSADVYYVSDQQGINNLFRYNLNDTVSTQVSNLSLSIKDYTFDQARGRLAYISIADGKESVFLETFNGLDVKFSDVTRRRALEVSKLLADRRKARTIENPALLDSIQKKLEFIEVRPPEQKLDSLKEGAINTENYEFKNESKVDTRDYQFEKPEENKSNQGRNFLSIYQNNATENTIQGPDRYENRFQTDNVVTSTLIDELRSFSILAEIQMNDYLENHSFSGGILVPLSFNQGYDVFAEYQYLKHRIDLKAAYTRNSIVRIDRQSFLDQRYNLDRFELGLGYPLTQRLRFELNPFFTQTRFTDRDFRLLLPVTAVNPARFNDIANSSASYLGINSVLVFDNSVVSGTNLHEGTRAKLTFEAHSKASSNAQSFSNVELDVRHYIKINKGMYLAARFFYGSYFGDAPKTYFLGGVDNWVSNSTEVGDPLTDDLAFQPLFTSVVNNTGVNANKSDILFNQFTNLRGYNYNTFQGRNVLTFSGEIRFPINQLLKNNELNSNFLRNLQIIGFYDIGSAWDDLSPFEDRNNQNIEEISTDGSPFSAVINNFSNPWLQSTGVGMRTMFFGFFSRFDFSFPVRDFKFQSPRLQISFGYDF